MSYRDERQAIEPPARKIIEGIEELESAVMERIRSGEWQASHIADLKSTVLDLNRIKFSLATLAQDNW